jgi:hypothetical protein
LFFRAPLFFLLGLLKNLFSFRCAKVFANSPDKNFFSHSLKFLSLEFEAAALSTAMSAGKYVDGKDTAEMHLNQWPYIMAIDFGTSGSGFAITQPKDGQPTDIGMSQL